MALLRCGNGLPEAIALSLAAIARSRPDGMLRPARMRLGRSPAGCALPQPAESGWAFNVPVRHDRMNGRLGGEPGFGSLGHRGAVNGPRPALRLGGRSRRNPLLDHHIDRSTGHHQMLDAIAINQQQLPLAVNRGNLAEADPGILTRTKERTCAWPEISPAKPAANAKQHQQNAQIDHCHGFVSSRPGEPAKTLPQICVNP